MPFVRRSGSWLYVSDSTRLRHGAGTAARRRDDSLAQFPSETTSHETTSHETTSHETTSHETTPHETTPHETTPQMMIVPDISIAERERGDDVRTSGNHIHRSTRERTASHSRTRLHLSQRRALRLVASLPTIVRRLSGRAITAIRMPLLMERVRDLRRLSASTTLTSFGGGAAAGVLVMWFAGAQPALPGGPSTTQAVTLRPTLSPPDRPASPQNVQLAAEGMRPIVPRPVGYERPQRRLIRIVPPDPPASPRLFPGGLEKQRPRRVPPTGDRSHSDLHRRRTSVCKWSIRRFDAPYFAEPACWVTRCPHRGRRVSALVGLDPGCSESAGARIGDTRPRRSMTP